MDPVHEHLWNSSQVNAKEHLWWLNQHWFRYWLGATRQQAITCSNVDSKLEQLERLHSEDTPAASLLPILLSHIGSQVKRRHSQRYKYKEFAQITNFLILKQTLHATHLLKLLDNMCKYEMDPTSIVKDTERTRFCPQTDRRPDEVKPVFLPFNFVEAKGIIMLSLRYKEFMCSSMQEENVKLANLQQYPYIH